MSRRRFTAGSLLADGAGARCGFALRFLVAVCEIRGAAETRETRVSTAEISLHAGTKKRHQVRYFAPHEPRISEGLQQELHRDMEMLVFGHAGMPLVVFPTSMGRFFEYEDRGMIGVLAAQD